MERVIACSTMLVGLGAAVRIEGHSRAIVPDCGLSCFAVPYRSCADVSPPFPGLHPARVLRISQERACVEHLWLQWVLGSDHHSVAYS